MAIHGFMAYTVSKMPRIPEILRSSTYTFVGSMYAPISEMIKLNIDYKSVHEMVEMQGYVH